MANLVGKGNIPHRRHFYWCREHVQYCKCTSHSLDTVLTLIQVDSVIKTSIALPVKERIAEGLGRAGTSNTLKLCTYNAVLGVIAFFSTGAIRQFCAFAIVVLVAHWFLVHTFFVTVLSIDIQRLEVSFRIISLESTHSPPHVVG